MTLAADLLLLAIDPERLTVRASAKIGYSLMGADLVELTIARRVDVVDGRIGVVDTRPTGDRCLDAALASIVSRSRPPRAKTWVSAQRRDLRDDYIGVLEEQHAISTERRRALGLFTVSRYRVLDVQRQAEIRARVTAIAHGKQPASPRERALAGLTWSCGLASALLPGAENREARKHLEQIARGRDDRDSVDAVVRATRGATDAAVRASTDAAIDAAIHAAIHASVDAAHHAAAGGHDAGAGGGHH